MDVPAPILNKTNEASECIPPPAAGVEGRINYTATCVSPSGSVVWLIGDYTMVDRDQFKDEFYGVRIEDAHPNDSRMTLYPEGADFLLDSFGNRSFTIRCQTIVNEVNIRRSENLFTFYGGCKGREIWLFLKFLFLELLSTFTPYFQFVQLFLVLK